MRLLWILAVAAALAGGAARADLTIQPEVLLIKAAPWGTEKAFEYAKLKPLTVAGKTVTFRYRASVDTVTCDITASEPQNNVVHVTLMVQRTRIAADGHEDTTSKTTKLDLRLDKPVIVDTQPHTVKTGKDESMVVDYLQLTASKP